MRLWYEPLASTRLAEPSGLTLYISDGSRKSSTGVLPLNRANVFDFAVDAGPPAVGVSARSLSGLSEDQLMYRCKPEISSTKGRHFFVLKGCFCRISTRAFYIFKREWTCRQLKISTTSRRRKEERVWEEQQVCHTACRARHLPLSE